jgi:hypothetical protein
LEDEFQLPPAIRLLVEARNHLREHYANTGLTFTLDGNLVGDLGEALAMELFGISLSSRRSETGIDGYSIDGRSVQVKATGVRSGPAFRPVETRADHLLFFDLDLEKGIGRVAYNGPEYLVTEYLPANFTKQRQVSMFRVRAANSRVRSDQRLPRRAMQG